METFSALLALCAGNSPVPSPHKGQWRGAFIFSLICAWINRWENSRDAGDLRRYRPHYDVIVMSLANLLLKLGHGWSVTWSEIITRYNSLTHFHCPNKKHSAAKTRWWNRTCLSWLIPKLSHRVILEHDYANVIMYRIEQTLLGHWFTITRFSLFTPYFHRLKVIMVYIMFPWYTNKGLYDLQSQISPTEATIKMPLIMENMHRYTYRTAPTSLEDGTNFIYCWNHKFM